MKSDALKHLPNFIGKHLCRNLVVYKVAVLRSATIFNKRSSTEVFSCEFFQIFMEMFYTENFRTNVFDFLETVSTFLMHGKIELNKYLALAFYEFYRY